MEVHYRQALALAEPRGMRLLVVHCELGLRQTPSTNWQTRARPGVPRHRDDDIPRNPPYDIKSAFLVVVHSRPQALFVLESASIFGVQIENVVAHRQH